MINFDFYDQEKFHRACLVHVDIANPGMPVEKIQELASSEEIKQEVAKQFLVVDLSQHIYEEYEGRMKREYCRKRAQDIVYNAPEEILVNIQEYLSNEPISDIKVHGISINDIVNHFKPHRFIHFLHVVECFVEWKKINYYDDKFWFHYFARM